MEEIRNLLPGVFRGQLHRQNPPLLAVLAPLWSAVAGPAVGQQSRPAEFCDGTLTLDVGCPTWAAQLGHLREEIRAEVNSYLGRPIVKKVRIRCVAGRPGKGQPGHEDGAVSRDAN